MTGLTSVGQLARRAGLTTKALRHYDRIGLLRPAVVDASGYRWYAPVQVATAARIALLGSVDVPIEEVRRRLLLAVRPSPVTSMGRAPTPSRRSPPRMTSRKTMTANWC